MCSIHILGTLWTPADSARFFLGTTGRASQGAGAALSSDSVTFWFRTLSIAFYSLASVENSMLGSGSRSATLSQHRHLPRFMGRIRHPPSARLCTRSSSALSDRQISVMDSHDLSAQVGPLATHCSTRDSCPGDIWGRVDGRLVVKGTVVMVGEDIEASLAFFRRDNSEPADRFQATFTSDIANRFAVDAALIVDDLLSMTDDVAVNGLAVAASAAMAVEEDALGPVPSEDLEAEPSATLEADGPATPTVEEQERRERRYMRLPRGLYQEFKQSKMSRDEFLDEKRFRAKKFFVELAPGLVFGDIQRRYTAVARVIGKSADQYYERDQLLPGTAFSLVAGFGYAPTWWMDGVQLGIEFPQDFISALNTRHSGISKPGTTAQRTATTSFKPALAVTLVLEPRVRVYARPTGLVKPYPSSGGRCESTTVRHSRLCSGVLPQSVGRPVLRANRRVRTRVRHPSERQRLSREQLHPPPRTRRVRIQPRCSVLSPRR